MDLSQTTALVTGAGHRIGRAIALGLSEAGARVGVHYLSSNDAAAETVRMVEAMGNEAASFRADLCDPAQCSALIRSVSERMGPVRVLVNNASVFGRRALPETSADDWDHYFAVNVRAPFLLTQAMATSLAPGVSGKVINLGDWRTARKDRFAYGASKAALSGLTRSLAYALAPSIQVNEVALGAILPPADIEAGLEAQARDRGTIPAGRTGTLNEVVQAVLALCHNDYITGERIHVDGGRHIA